MNKTTTQSAVNGGTGSNLTSSNAIDREAIKDKLAQGLQKLEVPYGDRALDNLVAYLVLLDEWNQTHNLTAIDDIDEMISVHVLDCASVKPYVKGGTMLDVGSGAGLPGMVWAILSPALDVTSIESRNKKVQFQMYVANQLKLQNFHVENTRIEDYRPVEKFAMVISRAFSSIENFVSLSEHCISANGRWLAMKGVVPKDEIKYLKRKNYKFDTYALAVPFLDADRNLIVIKAKN